MQRINQSIIESRLVHSLGLSQSRSARNVFPISSFDRDNIESYDPTLPSDHIIWSRGDFPILSRTYQKKALHTFEICWKHQWLKENKIANALLKSCLKEWNQRLILESRWIEWLLEDNTNLRSDTTRILADIIYNHSGIHLGLSYNGWQITLPSEWFASPKTMSILSHIRTFFSR